jgi:glutamine synthetase
VAHLDEAELQSVQDRLKADDKDVLRLGYADMIGVERGRDILVGHMARTIGFPGVAFCRAAFHTSPMGDTVPVEGGLTAGLPDVLAFPDLSTLRPLPWEPGVVHAIADIYNPDGSPCEDSPRHVLRSVCEKFDELGHVPVIGPELEFYVLERCESSPNGWQRYGEATGNVYVSGLKGDPENVLLRSLRHLDGYGIDVVAANHEFASGQFEINLWHSGALDAADRAFRFKIAMQELARQEGKKATFMAKPFNDEGGSGFHLHFSLTDQDGTPLFDDPEGRHGLSDLARHAIAGVLEHASAIAAFNNPTINSYKRFGPDTLAPWLIDWGLDNRSAMVRVPPERGRAARMEVRLGDATANPYLAVSAVLAGAYLGIVGELEPPAPLEGYGYDTARSSMLPATLDQSLDALEADNALGEVMGKGFVDSFLAYKRNEIDRFNHYVTDWEFREYSYHL